MSVAGLVLAAGGGTRLGRPKALVRLDGELLVERVCRILAGGGCDPVVVVLGADAATVRASAVLPAVVENPAWREGLGSSLRVGLAALDRAVQAVVVALVDQPFIGSAAVERLIASWHGGAVAAVATYVGQPRNPVLLTRAVFAEVAASAQGDVGARAWLRAHTERVTSVPCDDTGNPCDIDTPADLDAAQGVDTPRSGAAGELGDPVRSVRLDGCAEPGVDRP